MNEIEKLRKEFNDRLDALEKNQNGDWVEKILKHLENKCLYFPDYFRVKKILLRELDLNQYEKYYKKTVLTWIIQAVADILNEGRDISKDWSEFYLKNGVINKMSHYNSYYFLGAVKFDLSVIDQAQSILENLNRINILKMYFEVGNEK